MSTTPPNNITSPSNNLLAKALEEHNKTAVLKSEDESPHVLILGPSGSGKSRSIKNLPKESTFVLNAEDKTLPFQEAKEFKLQAKGVKTVAKFAQLLQVAKNEPSVKYIVIDSLTKYLELLMQESRVINKNYDIFNYYNSAVYDLLSAIKTINNKIVFVLGIDELVPIDLPSGAKISRRFCWVEGKVHSTKIEKEFSLVLYTDVKVVPGSNPPKSEYRFATNGDGVTSAKSPEGMFDFYIPNDLKLVADKLQGYYGLKF